MSIDDRSPPYRLANDPERQLAAYCRAARRPGIRTHVDRLLAEIGRLGQSRREGDPTLCAGAAVAVAQAALVLAVSRTASNKEHACKRETLRGAVLPLLEAVGFEHVGALIEAALACDINAAVVVRGSYTRN